MEAAKDDGVRIVGLSVFIVACGSPVETIVADASAPDAPPPVVEDAAIETSVEASVIDAAVVDTCKKHLTVLFAVGTGTSALKSHAGNCWSVLDADGSANKSFRKCSTGIGTVENPSAPSYAFDDTNPNNALSDQQSFLQQCAAGATGDGFEYMAYRGSWRLLSANHLKAFFAELYAGDGDVDDYWPSEYVGNAQLAKHTVYPMINIGPTAVANPANAIKTDALAMCKTVDDGGYFGVYVGTWNVPMTSTDARIVALSDALDTCTGAN